MLHRTHKRCDFTKVDYKGIVYSLLIVGFLFISSSARGQDISLRDDFETETLSSIWTTKTASKNALRHIISPTRNGHGAIAICVFPGAQTAIGGDGQFTERAELREAPDVRLRMGTESWYAFSFFLPAEFPIVNTRLVIASWKQSFHETWKDRSPMVSLRYMEGKLIICVERDRGQRKLYIQKYDLRNKWTDMVFHIIPKASKKIPKYFKDGLLQVWMNGHQIIDYKGALGFIDDEDEIYFKLGLYRDHMQLPMRIIFDRFRRGRTYQEVSITK